MSRTLPDEHDNASLVARVQRLEEALGFVEHERGQMHEQLISLMGELREVKKRLAALESGVERRFAAIDAKRDDEPNAESSET